MNGPHQWTESTNTNCNQWLSLAKITLKVPPIGKNRSLAANTSNCGEGISRRDHLLGEEGSINLQWMWCLDSNYCACHYSIKLDMKPFSQWLLEVLWCLCKPNHFRQRRSCNTSLCRDSRNLTMLEFFGIFYATFLVRKYLASKSVKHLHEVKLCANYTIVLLVRAKRFPRTRNISLVQYWCCPH